MSTQTLNHFGFTALSHQQGSRGSSHQALPQCTESRRCRDVLMEHTVLLANIAGDMADGVVAMVTNAREQMVFDLGGQSECHVEPEVRLRCKVDTLCDLHLSPRVILVGVRVEDHVGDLGTRNEDGPRGEVHAQVAQDGGAEGIVQDAPQGDLEKDSTQAVVDFVPANMTTDKQVHDHALHTELDHGANEDARQGQCLHPPRQLISDPDVLHVDVFLGIPILVCAHMVANDMLVVPAHRRSNQEEARKHAQAVDPFVLADLLVAALMGETSAHGGDNASGKQAGKGSTDNEKQPHHDAPHDRQSYESVRAHSCAAASTGEGLPNSFLYLLIERIRGWRSHTVGLENLPVLVVPRMIRFKKRSAVTATPCQDSKASSRMLIHEIMQVVRVAVDVPQIWIECDKLLVLLGRCLAGRIRGARGLRRVGTITLGGILSHHL
mmetsp:Transcript_7649/g.16208  ORF Transcript_7649/g.16208 Transcript_7649/m.16208 type:complete len:437 (-) Transcript_7649:50-1360(-)